MSCWYGFVLFGFVSQMPLGNNVERSFSLKDFLLPFLAVIGKNKNGKLNNLSIHYAVAIAKVQ